MFKYYLKSNRPIFGAVPSGYVNAEKFENAVRVPRKGYVYGVATYDKPLTAKQIVNYDLRPEDDSEVEKVNTYSANCILINCLDDYFVNSNDAAMVEIENEINNRLAEDKKRQDFIKSVLNMGDLDSNKEIKLIGQDADGGRTLTARNVAFNGFDYCKMSDGLYHVRIIPQGHETFSTLASYESEEQVLKVIQELGAAIQRGDETFSFAPVEGKKFEVGRWYYDLFDSKKRPAYKVTRRTKKMVTLIDDFGEIIKRKVRIDLGVEEIYIGETDSLDETALKATGFCTNADEIQKAEDDLAYSLGQDVAEVEEVNAVTEKISEIKNRPRKSIVDWTDAIFQNVTVPEIFKAQKFLKKYLKLGQLDLAENIFAMLKTLCKNYRAA